MTTQPEPDGPDEIVPAAPANNYMVATGRDHEHLTILRLGCELTKDDAISLAAWLAVMADPLGERFAAALDAVRST